MKLKDNEVILKLTTDDIAKLVASLFAVMMMADSDESSEVRNDVQDLLHKISHQL